MNASELLRCLEEEGVQVWREGEDLRYRAPRGRLAPGLIDALVSRKAEIVQLLQRRWRAGSALQAWSPPSRTPEHPLSFAQQRMWFLRQLEPKSCALNVAIGFSLSGRLDVAALQKGLQDLVARHETFRTTCAIEDGVPVQVIAPPDQGRDSALEVIDLRALPESSQQREVQRLAKVGARRTFDLETLPLLRCAVFQLAENRWTFVLTTHHFVIDGWSVEVLFRNLSAFYNGRAGGKPPQLRKLAIRYRDYARWQRERLQGSVLDDLLGYWKKQLEGVAELNIPTDRPVPVARSGAGATFYFELPTDLRDALKSLSRREEVTLFMTLLAAFKTLLYRYSQQDDIVVGTAISDRGMAETQTLVGCFANTLVLRTRFEGNPTFRQLLRRVHDTSVEAFDHQDLPFQVLVEQLRAERLNVRNPLVRASFVLHQHASDQALNLEGLTTRPFQIVLGMSRFDILLELHDERERLSANIEYDTDLFDEVTIRRMAGHFQNLLVGIVADPQQTVSDVPILAGAELNQILVDWNGLCICSSSKTIHEVFAEQARRRGSAVAVVFGERELTYEELDVRSDRLAGYLGEMGIRRGARVGLCLEPSVEMVIGLLGILKAGAAYVPIDPDYPEERVNLMLEEAEIAVLLLSSEGEGSRFGSPGVRTVKVEEAWQSPPPGSDGDRQAPALRSEDAAYVIFTSGSTGKPKGVCVPHRAVINLVVNCDYVELGAEDVVAQISNCCFDAAVFEIWGALLNGSRLVGIGREDVLSAERFSAQLERHGVTTLFVTTALFNELVHERAEIFGSVRNVLFGGEECDAGAVRRVLESGSPPERLLHMYGPTETTTFATWYEVKGAAKSCPWRVPIGRPITNTQVYILDAHLEAVPIGVPGEIWIGGEGVAHGYLQSPELNEERFVASPFMPGRRLYRTGDRGRFLTDGNIEFLGRIDQQVKIRGFRIEPGEVESVLMSHPGVRQAAVCARERSAAAKDKQLVGYVVMEQGSSASSQSEPELRAFLKSKLPDYMVPTAFVLLEKLPLTSTGKIDRLALPAPALDKARVGSIHPRSETEKMVAEAWSAVIDGENIGVYEDFFQLGGHSLLAMRVVARLRSASNLDIPLRVFFENPTVAALAEYIEGAHCTAPKTSVGPGVVDREELVL